MYTLGQAEKATGRRKSTILNAINKGRISAKKDEQGHWQIDPAELHRVYPPDSSNSTKNSTSNDIEPHETGNEIIELRVQNEALRERISDKDKTIGDLEAGRERERRQLESAIDDLRSDRDHWREQAERHTRLLADMREKADKDAEAAQKAQQALEEEKRRGFLRRLFGG